MIRKGLPLAIALFLTATTIIFAESGSAEKGNEKNAQTRKFMMDARVFHGKGYYQLAEENYLRVIDLEPNHFKANFELGEMYFYKTYQRPKAVYHFETAINNIPKDPASYAELYFFAGQAYHLVGRYKEAIDAYDTFKGFIATTKEGENLRREVDNYIAECKRGQHLEAESNSMGVRIENLGGAVNTRFAEYVPVVCNNDSILMYTSRRNMNTGGAIDDKDEKYYEDMYIARMGKSGYEPPRKFSESDAIVRNVFNTESHDAVVGISYDEKTLLTYRERMLWMSEFVSGNWKFPEMLPDVINGGEIQTHASFSGDGRKMFFTSMREEGEGKLDIYMSRKRLDGSWGEPQSLGPLINTAENEDSPEISEDGNTLYFSSRGHKGIGGYDIYKTEFVDGRWTPPVNMGIPFNSSADDIYYKPTKGEKGGYFSSSREGGYGDMDLYSVYIGPYPLFNECVSMTKGTYAGKLDASLYVKNLDPNMVYQWDTGDQGYAEGVNVTHNYQRPGLYQVKLNEFDPVKRKTRYVSDNIQLVIGDVDHLEFLSRDTVAVGENVAFDASPSMVRGGILTNYFWDFGDNSKFEDAKNVLHIFNEEGNKEVRLELEVESSETGEHAKYCMSKTIVVMNAEAYAEMMEKRKRKVEEEALRFGKGMANLSPENAYLARVQLDPIYFDYDKATIRKDAKRTLERNIVKLKELPNVIIKVSAHTDSRGSYEYNYNLSKRRARTVVSYLVRHGIPRKRVAAVLSSGETELVNNCGDDISCSRREHQLNRRAEFTVIGVASEF